LDIQFAALYYLERNVDAESTIVDSLEQLGLFPSPGALWDLVPLSFVVDWFLNIGEVLHALRYERDTWHYTLLSRIESQKFRFTWSQEFIDQVFGPGFTPESSVDGTLYRRSVAFSWGSTDPMLLYGGSGITENSQWFAAASLVIQRALN
jgi:hypothetical protein